jgi:hypothetical protein
MINVTKFRTPHLCWCFWLGKENRMTHFGGLAQTSVRDVCDMLIPLEAEVKSFHPSAAAFLRPQSSS